MGKYYLSLCLQDKRLSAFYEMLSLSYFIHWYASCLLSFSNFSMSDSL